MYIRSKGKNKNKEIIYVIVDKGETIKYIGTAKKLLEIMEKVPKNETKSTRDSD